MSSEITPEDQLKLATLVFPVIALVVNLAVNSVKEEDGWKYRWFVGGSGLFIITPAFVVMFFAIIGYMEQKVIQDIFIQVILCFGGVLFLTLGVTLREIYRGYEDGGKGSYLLGLGLTLVVLLIWSISRFM